MKILGTGLEGFVGLRIVELLQDRYEPESSRFKNRAPRPFHLALKNGKIQKI